MTVAAPEFKNIVVVGASGAGHPLVNALAGKLPATHRILLVERNEFVVHMPTIVRALVVPGEYRGCPSPMSEVELRNSPSWHSAAHIDQPPCPTQILPSPCVTC